MAEHVCTWCHRTFDEGDASDWSVISQAGRTLATLCSPECGVAWSDRRLRLEEKQDLVRVMAEAHRVLATHDRDGGA